MTPEDANALEGWLYRYHWKNPLNKTATNDKYLNNVEAISPDAAATANFYWDDALQKFAHIKLLRWPASKIFSLLFLLPIKRKENINILLVTFTRIHPPSPLSPHMRDNAFMVRCAILTSILQTMQRNDGKNQWKERRNRRILGGLIKMNWQSKAQRSERMITYDCTYISIKDQNQQQKCNLLTAAYNPPNHIKLVTMCTGIAIYQ